MYAEIAAADGDAIQERRDGAARRMEVPKAYPAAAVTAPRPHAMSRKRGDAKVIRSITDAANARPSFPAGKTCFKRVPFPRHMDSSDEDRTNPDLSRELSERARQKKLGPKPRYLWRHPFWTMRDRRFSPAVAREPAWLQCAVSRRRRAPPRRRPHTRLH